MNEKLNALVSHGAVKPEHVEKMIQHANAWHPDDDLDSKKFKQTGIYGKGLRSIAGKSEDPAILGKFKDFSPHAEYYEASRIRSKLLANPHTSSDILHHIGLSDPHFLRSVSSNQKLSPEHIDSLYKEGGDQTNYHNLFKHKNLSDKTFDRMMDHTKDQHGVNETTYKLRMLAQNPNLSKNRQERIYHKASSFISTHFSGFDAVGELAAHRDLDHDLAKKIATDHRKDDDIMSILRNNRSLPPHVTE